jgi:aminoglycoside phosphotransferase (APT) family kinase protein
VTVPDDLARLLDSIGMPAHLATATPMSGGVSSDIRLVRTGERTVVAKRALAQLKVAAVWEAPVERSASEAAWLSFAAGAVPGSCPALLGFDVATGWLVMEHLDPATHRLWKSDLLGGTVDARVAAALGDRLGELHETATQTPGVREEFATDELFDALRLDPYLRTLLSVHPAAAPRIEALIQTTRSTRCSLVHGDVSPKNVLVGPHGPVLLDAECAWWGDPAFDVAFLLTHLVLKSVHRPADRPALLAAAAEFARAYTAHVTWERPDALTTRAAALLPAITLARVDGKSPVEYLDDQARADVRDRSLHALDGDLPLLAAAASLAGATP